MSFKSQVAKGLKWQAISIVGRQLLSLVVFTTLSRLLDPSAFGLVGVVASYLAFVTLFAEQGIGTALVQRSELDPEHLDTAFWFNLGCASLLCLGTIYFAGPVSLWFNEPRLAPLLRWSSLGLVISATTTIHTTLFVKAMDFRRPTSRTLIANVFGGTVGVVMAVFGYGVWALVAQQLGAALAGAAFLWTVSSYRPKARFSFTHLRDLMFVSSSVFSTSFLWLLSTRLDQIIVGRFMGVPTLGLYVIAQKIPDMAKMVTSTPVSEVSLPALSRLQGDHGRMCEVIYKGMELNAFMSFAVFIGIAAVAPDLIPLLFGSKWAAATGLCSLFSIYALVIGLNAFFHSACLASGGAGRAVLLNVWHTAGVLIACAVGVRFGITSLVLGLIVNVVIVAVPGLLFLRHRIGLSIWRYCEPCVVPASASLLMIGVIWLAGSLLPMGVSAVVVVACKIVLGAGAYIGFVLLFKRMLVVNLLDTVSHAIGRRSKAIPSANLVVPG